MTRFFEVQDLSDAKLAEIGQRIRDWRTKGPKGRMTQGDFGALAEISIATVSRVENGSGVDGATYARLAAAMNVSEGWLLDGVEGEAGPAVAGDRKPRTKMLEVMPMGTVAAGWTRDHAALLRQKRHALGMTVSTFAYTMGVTVEELFRIEEATMAPPLTGLLSVEQTLMERLHELRSQPCDIDAIVRDVIDAAWEVHRSDQIKKASAILTDFDPRDLFAMYTRQLYESNCRAKKEEGRDVS